MKLSVVLLSLWFSMTAFAKTEAPAAKVRNPASDAVETVKANSLNQAWARIVKKNAKVKAILKKMNAEYKECGGGVTTRPFDAGKMTLTSGKSSASSHYAEYLVPFINGCSGSGMIEEAALIARIGNTFTVDDEEAGTYYFYGFVKVETRALDSEKQGPDFQ